MNLMGCRVRLEMDQELLTMNLSLLKEYDHPFSMKGDLLILSYWYSESINADGTSHWAPRGSPG